MRSVVSAVSSLAIAIAAAVVALSTVLWLQARGFPHEPLVGETGFIERSSAILWFVAAAIFLVARARPLLDRVTLGYLSAMLGLRELDANKRIFDWDIAKFLNLTKSAIPLSERLAAVVLIFAPLILAAAVLLLRWSTGRRRRGAWRRYALYWSILLVIALIADKISWILEPLGVHPATFPERAFEESVELGLALFTVLASLAFVFHPAERPDAASDKIDS